MKNLSLVALLIFLTIQVAAQSPVAYYPFSGNANDVAGTNNGTVNGATLIADRFGEANSAFSFDGIDDFVSTANLAVTNTDNWSMMAWVKPVSISQVNGTMILNGFDNGVSGNGYAITMSDGSIGSGNVLTGFHCGLGLHNSGGVFPTNNIWYHIAATRQGGIVRYYINGSQTANTSTTGINPPTGSLRIGSQTGVRFWNGAIDEVKIYNVALTTLQIQQEYASSNRVQKPGSGNALSFDGFNDYVNIPDNNTLDITGNLTVETWFNTTANVGTYMTLVSKWFSGGDPTGGGSTFSLHFNNTGIQLLLQNSVNNVIGATSPSKFNDGKWHHVAGVWDGITAVLYVDGIPQGNSGNVPTFGSLNVNTHPVRIASDNRYPDGTGDRLFPGKIDEVRIWNTALNQSQLRDRMCKKITNTDPLYSNLVSYYNLDESSGSTAFDGTGNANNGTLVNGPVRITSGAAIGNASTNNYVSAGFPSANLSFPGQDNLSATLTSGTYTGEAGVHIYRVDEKPNTENGTSGVGINDRYFCVFTTNITTPQYTATYNYTGNLFVNAGNENTLALFKRNDNAATAWTNTAATLNTTDNTLTATGESTEYILGSTGAVLPVRLQSFTGTKQKTAVVLNWKTTDEINASHYDLQRSNDGISFGNIAKVPAKGKPENNYEHTDTEPLTGRNYYRLKQTDRNSNFKFSAVVNVIFEKPEEIVVYPNPAKDKINITLSAGGNRTVSIYSAAGTLVKTIKILSAGDTGIPVHDLAKGKYIIQVSNGVTIQTASFIKD